MNQTKPEKSIKTWRDNLIGVMSCTEADLLAHLWCQAILQVERQLMLLLQSNVEPNISAFSHVYRPHNYNEAPFVTIGMEALVHNKPNRRGKFAELCSKGYVLGTDFER